jgi:glucuronosyltransferase
MMLKPMGVSMDYASLPQITTEFDNQMSFIERVINVVQSEMITLFTQQFVVRALEERIRRDIPGARSLTELRGEASLLLLNSDPITYWPRSLPPSVIGIGALHTRPAKPLPEVIVFAYCSSLLV